MCMKYLYMQCIFVLAVMIIPLSLSRSLSPSPSPSLPLSLSLSLSLSLPLPLSDALPSAVRDLFSGSCTFVQELGVIHFNKMVNQFETASLGSLGGWGSWYQSDHPEVVEDESYCGRQSLMVSTDTHAPHTHTHTRARAHIHTLTLYIS